jgi:prophage regulatory protein
MTQLRTIRRPEVLRKTGLSKTTIHNLEAAGKFPRHWMLTPRVAVWAEHEVDAWLAASRSTPAAPAPSPDVALRRNAPGRGKASPTSRTIRGLA